MRYAHSAHYLFCTARLGTIVPRGARCLPGGENYKDVLQSKTHNQEYLILCRRCRHPLNAPLGGAARRAERVWKFAVHRNKAQLKRSEKSNAILRKFEKNSLGKRDDAKAAGGSNSCYSANDFVL